MEKLYNLDSIRTLSANEAVRLRPRLYFGECFEEGTLDVLPIEAMCHGLDEYMDGKCKSISITLHNDGFSVAYDAGMSLEHRLDPDICVAESFFTQLFVCSNEKKHLEVGESFCKMGLATVNFATERSELTTFYKGKKGHFVFDKGVTVSREITPAVSEEERTTFFMKPDKSLFGELKLTLEGVTKKARLIMDSLPGLEIMVQENPL